MVAEVRLVEWSAVCWRHAPSCPIHFVDRESFSISTASIRGNVGEEARMWPWRALDRGWPASLARCNRVVLRMTREMLCVYRVNFSTQPFAELYDEYELIVPCSRNVLRPQCGKGPQCICMHPFSKSSPC